MTKGYKIFIVLTISTAVISIMAIISSTEGWKRMQFKNGFNYAMSVASEGKYVEAQRLFSRLDADGLFEEKRMAVAAVHYCSACKNNDDGYYREAYKGKNKCDCFMKILTEDNIAFVKRKNSEITENYMAHKAEYDEQDRKDKEESKKREKEEAERKAQREKDKKNTKNNNTGKRYGSSSKKYTDSTVDPDDHDIEAYYEDYKDIEGFEDIDDAEDDFLDNPEYWDEY